MAVSTYTAFLNETVMKEDAKTVAILAWILIYLALSCTPPPDFDLLTGVNYVFSVYAIPIILI